MILRLSMITASALPEPSYEDTRRLISSTDSDRTRSSFVRHPHNTVALAPDQSARVRPRARPEALPVPVEITGPERRFDCAAIAAVGWVAREAVGLSGTTGKGCDHPALQLGAAEPVMILAKAGTIIANDYGAQRQAEVERGDRVTGLVITSRDDGEHPNSLEGPGPAGRGGLGPPHKESEPRPFAHSDPHAPGQAQEGARATEISSRLIIATTLRLTCSFGVDALLLLDDAARIVFLENLVPLATVTTRVVERGRHRGRDRSIPALGSRGGQSNFCGAAQYGKRNSPCRMDGWSREKL